LAQTETELLDNPVGGRPTLILRSPDLHAITEVVAEPLERSTPIGWWLFRQRCRPSINPAEVSAFGAREETLDVPAPRA
jgi:hypothetical protein